jgi:hypothetical protein
MACLVPPAEAGEAMAAGGVHPADPTVGDLITPRGGTGGRKRVGRICDVCHLLRHGPFISLQSVCCLQDVSQGLASERLRSGRPPFEEQSNELDRVSLPAYDQSVAVFITPYKNWMTQGLERLMVGWG